jgi:tetratricopeptide (TPR) repeat protein
VTPETPGIPPVEGGLVQAFGAAVQFYRSGKLAEAESLCRRLLAAAPGHARALHLLGTIALQSGRPAVAVAPLTRALAQRPNDAAIHNLLGTVYLQLGRHADAVASLETALRLEPDLAEAHCVLGAALAGLGRGEAAVAAFRAALERNPDMAQAHYNLAGLFADWKRRAEAVGHYREVLRLEPRNAVAHYKIGQALLADGAHGEAVDHFRAAYRLEPSYAEARHFAAIALVVADRWEEAAAQFEETLAAEPDDPVSHYSYGTALLMLGRLEAGFEKYEWRWQVEGLRAYRRAFAQPQWRGEDLAEKTLLVHCEQGFGDTLHFCRYAPLAARRCAKLYFEVQPELVKLMRQSLATERLEIVSRSPSFPGVEGLPASDHHSALLSLPHVFGTRLDTIPAEIPYLRADPVEIRKWAERLAPLPRPRVGVIWAGRAIQAQDSERSIPVARLAPILRVPGATFLSLQTEEPAAQLASLPTDIEIHDFTAELPDWADTAALLGSIDLVVTVDTAMAHLSGALGKKVWLLNRQTTDWRWLLEREDSPWYPTTRLFRQPRAGDWDSVIERVARTLEAWVELFRNRGDSDPDRRL